MPLDFDFLNWEGRFAPVQQFPYFKSTNAQVLFVQIFSKSCSDGGRAKQPVKVNTGSHSIEPVHTWPEDKRLLFSWPMGSKEVWLHPKVTH